MEREESVCKRVRVTKRSLVGVLFQLAQKGNIDALRKLLRYRSSDGSTIDVNTQDTASGGATLLHIACSKGYESMVVALLGAGADVSIVAAYGTSVLHEAAKQENINIIHRLLERGAHVMMEDEFIRMPLHIACHFGNHKVALALIRCGAQPRARDINERSCVWIAASRGHANVLQVLLDESKENAQELANIIDMNGWAPVHAAIHAQSEECVKCLVKMGAKLDVLTNDGDSPLSLAAKSGNIMMVRLLLEFGAPIDGIAIQKKGLVEMRFIGIPLHWALFHGFNDVVSLLLSRGADMYKRDEDGIQAPFVAIETGNIDGVRVLVDHGISLKDLRSEFGETVLQRASRCGSFPIARFLIECGMKEMASESDLLPSAARRKPKSDNGFVSSLHWAIIANHVRIVWLLLEHGWDVNISDGDGNRPLHVAAATGNARVCQWLLDRGANPNYVDAVYRTPLGIAIHYAHSRVAQLLIEYGCDVDDEEMMSMVRHGMVEEQVLHDLHGSPIARRNRKRFESSIVPARAYRRERARVVTSPSKSTMARDSPFALRLGSGQEAPWIGIAKTHATSPSLHIQTSHYSPSHSHRP